MVGEVEDQNKVEEVLMNFSEILMPRCYKSFAAIKINLATEEEFRGCSGYRKRELL